ncbi:MAG: Eco57I restriction-modification methylase domain-containing protein [Alphaproteobacteria bacterium]|nr:Eco57I restriction-modification methylase domain-containing protein [Alphaproteobacteria bacterium]
MRPQKNTARQALEQPDALVPGTARQYKADLGQFMTPPNVARFMASLFVPGPFKACRLLDAGAGAGALSCAFLDRWAGALSGFTTVDVTACEIDDRLRSHLKRHLRAYPHVTHRIVAGDYIEATTREDVVAQTQGGFYTHIILNPPYKKIRSNSAHRQALRRVGIETVNLYSAFVALALTQALPRGQIVAIIPRSFCNGPYYRRFRDFILERAALRQIHLFGSRKNAFRDDGVLQENIILCLERGGEQGAVRVSTSTDDSFADLATHDYPFERIVLPDDRERFIHVPAEPRALAMEPCPAVSCTLADLGIHVSTGPVVDFRLRAYLRDNPEKGTVPLLYPAHFSGARMTWPIPGMKKPNAILHTCDTGKWLFPRGFYCVVRRFSSKEEKRRIHASVVDPGAFEEASMLGFENHLNLFHENRRGLPEALAHGLAAFLNMTAVDAYFRSFNGHTQVNATDLRMLRYPSRERLIRLGEWAMEVKTVTQEQIEARLGMRSG